MTDNEKLPRFGAMITIQLVVFLLAVTVVLSACSGTSSTSSSLPVVQQTAAGSAASGVSAAPPPRNLPPRPGAPQPTPPPPQPTPPPTPAPTGTITQLSAAAAAYLNLDLAHLANYAHPTFPRYYDGQVFADDNTPASNPTTDRTATLGRVLFNDKRLSLNNMVACASCHQQSVGFADANRFSAGFAGVLTTRHAPALENLRFYRPGTMFWDKRAASIEAQATQPIQNSNEMGFDAAHGGMSAVIAKMQALPYYPEMFQFAFGDSAISEVRIQNALASFERSILSTSSRWDVGYAQVYNPQAPNKNLDVDVPGLTAQENRGRALFMGRPPGGLSCAQCHVPPTFALAANSLSNGLDAGEATIFKSPSLKNIGIIGPYMHDGRLPTLAAVVDHYDHGVLNGPALDPRLKGPNGQPRVLNLSAADKAALVAFMQALNDPAPTLDPKFSSPFKK